MAETQPAVVAAATTANGGGDLSTSVHSQRRAEAKKNKLRKPMRRQQGLDRSSHSTYSVSSVDSSVDSKNSASPSNDLSTSIHSQRRAEARKNKMRKPMRRQQALDSSRHSVDSFDSMDSIDESFGGDEDKSVVDDSKVVNIPQTISNDKTKKIDFR